MNTLIKPISFGLMQRRTVQEKLKGTPRPVIAAVIEQHNKTHGTNTPLPGARGKLSQSVIEFFGKNPTRAFTDLAVKKWLS